MVNKRSGFIISLFLLAGCVPTDTEPVEQEQSEQTETQKVMESGDRTIDAIAKAEPSVVGVSNIQLSGANGEIQMVPGGTGSGVIYKEQDGYIYIVTNHHVVSGAQEIELTLQNEEKRSVELVGSDPYTDLAVLRMESQGNEKVIEVGSSSDLKKGQTVMTIGNPLGLEFFGTVTQGIISSKERTIPVDINQDGVMDWQVEVMQTDAPINPGNSGGALINQDGQLVGINSMKIVTAQIEGIGFVIPIDEARLILRELEENGEIVRPQLGIGLVNLRDVPGLYKEQYLNIERDRVEGVVVAQTEEGEQELQKMDIIIEADGIRINDTLTLKEIIFEKEIGDTVILRVIRGGREMSIEVVLQ